MTYNQQVEQALRKLGSDIRDARRRRRIPVSVLAERVSISPITLHKVELGTAGVAFGTWAAILFSLGMLERLAEVANPKYDIVGFALLDERLPQRIRLPKRRPEPEVAAPEHEIERM